MLNYKILSTAILLSAQSLILVSAVPLQAEGNPCQYQGCEAAGTSRAYCQGGSTAVSGQVKFCPEAQVCIMTDASNYRCGAPGEASAQAPAAQPSAMADHEADGATVPGAPAPSSVAPGTPPQGTGTAAAVNTHMDGWKDKQGRTGEVTYYDGSTPNFRACGGKATDDPHADQAPFYAAVDVGFFPDPGHAPYNPNTATVCNKKVRLSCK
jgi:hypothetical protein